jgi:hypothetical protein
MSEKTGGQKPTINRAVVFVERTASDKLGHTAALITSNGKTPETPNLVVFSQLHGTRMYKNVEYNAEGDTPNTWHWAKRE